MMILLLKYRDLHNVTHFNDASSNHVCGKWKIMERMGGKKDSKWQCQCGGHVDLCSRSLQEQVRRGVLSFELL